MCGRRRHVPARAGTDRNHVGSKKWFALQQTAWIGVGAYRYGWLMELKDLYRAFEFAHHAERLRGSLSLITLSRNTRLHDLLVDLKVLAA